MNKNLYFILVLFFIVFSQKAHTAIPVIEADTIFQGFETATVSGILLANNGNSLILMHNAQPIEVDVITHQVVREFEKVPNATGSGEMVRMITGKNYITGVFGSTILDGITDFSGTIFWDYSTGKIIKSLHNYYFIINQNQTFTWQSGKRYFYKYDVSNFKKVDSMYIDPNLPGDNGKSEWCKPALIPNSNKILFGVNRFTEYEDNNHQTIKNYYLAELYLLDFDTKKYTKIEIPYESGQKSSQISGISVTETGKYNIVRISRVYYFYDKDFKFLYKLGISDFTEMTNINDLYNSSLTMTISDEYIIFLIFDTSAKNFKMIFYNIKNRNITKYLSFLGSGVYDKSSRRIAMYGSAWGLTGMYSLDALPVLDLPKPINLEITYSNNQLEFYSDVAFAGEAQIYDISGKLIANLGSQPFTIGKNTIPLNRILPVGVYILTIINCGEPIIKKFMVE